MGLKPSRFLCHRPDYHHNGDCEHKLVLNTADGDDVRYGPYVSTMKHMAGPRVNSSNLCSYEADD